MKKTRFLFFFLPLYILFNFKIFSNTGIGASSSLVLTEDFPLLFSFTARSDKNPWSAFINLELDDDASFYKLSFFADDWFISERLSNHIDYYVLWGVSGGFLYDENSLDDTKLVEISTGCRFGGGLDFFLFKRKLELFAQAVWNPYFGIKVRDKEASPFLRPVCFPCTAGIRFFF